MWGTKPGAFLDEFGVPFARNDDACAITRRALDGFKVAQVHGVLSFYFHSIKEARHNGHHLKY